MHKYYDDSRRSLSPCSADLRRRISSSLRGYPSDRHQCSSMYPPDAGPAAQLGHTTSDAGPAVIAGTRNVDPSSFLLGARAQHAAQPKGGRNKSRRPVVRTKSDADFVPRGRENREVQGGVPGALDAGPTAIAGTHNVRRGPSCNSWDTQRPTRAQLQ